MNITDLNIPLICYVSFFLLIWFESDIVTTISKLTNTRNLLRIPNYEKYKIENDPLSSYPNFLYNEYPGWITKLLSCPICLCFWTTLFTTLGLTILVSYPISLFLLIFPINYCASLLLYLIIRKHL